MAYAYRHQVQQLLLVKEVRRHEYVELVNQALVEHHH